MDANKKLALQFIEYRIKRTCGNCRYANIKGSDWGTCDAAVYLHQKHTQSERHVSINRYGCCQEHMFDEEFRSKLGEYNELVKG